MDLIPGFSLPVPPPVVDPKRAVDDALFLALTAVIGLGWIVAYVGIIRRGLLDRVPGMPMVALAVNASWEFIFAFVFPHPTEQKYVNAIWFFVDVAIAVQVWRYGRRDFPRLGQRAFRLLFLGLFAYAFAAVLLISYETGDIDGGYTAFGSNVVMSALFVSMLLRRDSVAGQSMYIAVGKLVGSLAAAVLFINWFPERPLLYLFYVSILALDVAYVLLYVRVARRDGVPLLRRF